MVVNDDALDRQSLLLRGSLDMCVLVLVDREPQHAYGVVEKLAAFGFEQISYGTIYPLVTRLRRQGLVDQHSEASTGGPARNILTTTPNGRAAMARWITQWQQTATNISALLDAPAKGEAHALQFE